MFLPPSTGPLDDAHRVAHQHGTGVVVMREGKVVTIDPDPEMYGEEQGER